MIIELFDLSKLNQSDINILKSMDSDFSKMKNSITTLISSQTYAKSLIKGDISGLYQQINNSVNNLGITNSDLSNLSLAGKINYYNQMESIVRVFVKDYIKPMSEYYRSNNFLSSVFDEIIALNVPVYASKYEFINTMQQYIPIISDKDYDVLIQQGVELNQTTDFLKLKDNDITANNFVNATLINDAKVIQEYVGNAIDSNDSYKFSVNSSANLSLKFNNIIGNNASVYLYNANNQLLDSKVIINELNFEYNNLNAGTYYIQIKPTSENNKNVTYYEFSTAISNLHITEKSNILGTVKENPFIINNLNSKNYFKSEEVLSTQPFDYYQFNLNKKGVFSFKLTNLDENADLILINQSTNKVIKSSKKLKNRDEILENVSLNKGNYLLKITNVNNSNTFYDLAIVRSKENLGFEKAPKLQLDQEVNINLKQSHTDALNYFSDISYKNSILNIYNKNYNILDLLS